MNRPSRGSSSPSHESRVTIHAVLAFAFFLGAFPAAAQEAWSPSRNVEIIVASGAGGAADREARVVQSFLQKIPGLPVVNVVAFVLVLVSIVPVYLAHRLTSEKDERTGEVKPTAEAVAVP